MLLPLMSLAPDRRGGLRKSLLFAKGRALAKREKPHEEHKRALFWLAEVLAKLLTSYILCIAYSI